MRRAHQFLPNAVEDIAEKMLHSIGAKSIEELFADVPKRVRLTRDLNLPESMSELETERMIEKIFSKNNVYPEYLSFLGGGVWPHFVPAAVDEIISRSEFYTAYTPYQPEISQGILQALFEYQSLICDLTGMDVANSSMYDWATALGEAARMAARVTKRNRVLVPRNIGPDRLAVLQTYCNPVDITVEKIDYDRRRGEVSIEQLHQLLNDDVAAVYIESPNYFGVIESNAPAIVEETKRRGAISIVGVEPISLGLLKPPGEYGADIVVGEGQPLGIPMNFGGPLLGIFASRDEPNLIRQMPGRIIGLTEEKRTGEKGYTMVLQTREQHIRREKATSNICTNEALAAVAAAVYLSLMGGDGLRELSYQIISNSHFAANLISENKRIQTPYFDAPFFMDFTLFYRDQIQAVRIFRELHKRKILGCLPLAEHFPELSSLALLTVTEIHSHEDIERLASALKEVTG